MKTLFLIVVAIFILLFIIDKKAPLPIEEENFMKTKNKNNNENDKNMKQIPDSSSTGIIEVQNELSNEVLSFIKEINPLKSYKVWTYIESVNGKIPTFFKKCIDTMTQKVPDLIILTPRNIHKYLPNFPLEMDETSEIPLKKRVDTLFASILESHGGLCISPGTVVINVDDYLFKLKTHELVTIGSSMGTINSYNNKNYPNTYVIGSQKKVPIIIEYKRLLLQSIRKKLLNNKLHMDESYNILSHLIPSYDTKHFHYGPEYDGSYNSNMELVNIKDYLSTHSNNFLDKDKLMLLSIPYDTLLSGVQYQWLLNLHEDDFNTSDLEIKRLME